MHEKEFLKLLHNEEGRLLRIAWAMLGQESDAWDVLQEAVEQAWLCCASNVNNHVYTLGW